MKDGHIMDLHYVTIAVSIFSSATSVFRFYLSIDKYDEFPKFKVRARHTL